MVVETAIHHVNSAAAVGLGKATLAAFQWHLELILETRKRKTLNQENTRNVNVDSIKEILIGQIVLKSSKRKFEAS
jgi:hypothetical protein